MLMDEWMRRWNIPTQAVDELQQMLGALSQPSPKYQDATTEAGVQQRERLNASRVGGRLWRNNSGVAQVEGRHIRYGLCNESSRINASMKSADLIGIMPITVTPEMAGRTIGQFVAIETKAPGWTYRNTEREQAQLAFLILIASLGGDGRFVS